MGMRKRVKWNKHPQKSTKHILIFALPAGGNPAIGSEPVPQSEVQIEPERRWNVLTALCWESESLRVPPALVTPEWRPAPPARLQAPLQPAACLEVNEISIIACSSCLFIALWEWTPTAKQERRPGLREKAADGSRERPMPLQYTDTRPLGLCSGDPMPLGVTEHQVAGPGGGRLLVEPESRLRCSWGGGWQLGSTVLEKMRITIFFFFLLEQIFTAFIET